MNHWKRSAISLGVVVSLLIGCQQESRDVEHGERVAASKNFPQAKPDIILISIDSLRADHIGCYGYETDTTPTLDKLASEGARFDNAISTTSWTLPAHAAMFTGLYDSAHGAVDVRYRLDEKFHTLAEQLSSANYQTSGFFGGPFLHSTFGLDQGFATYISCMTTTPDNASVEEFRRPTLHQDSHRDITGPEILKRVREWIPTADDRPMFLFLHCWDVHYDYIPPQRYVHMFDPDYQGSVNGLRYSSNRLVHRNMSPRDLEHIKALYDGEIRFTDDIIKQILAVLDANGRLENALIIVTADHGDEFFEHGNKGHQKTLFDEVVRVPLIMRWPGKIEAGISIDDQVSLIDLLPTIAALTEETLPMEIHGRDLSPLLSGKKLRPEPALMELSFLGAQLKAVRTNEYKLILDPRSERGEFFDLSGDPGETANLAAGPLQNRSYAQANKELQKLLDDVESWKSRAVDLAPQVAEPDPAMMRRLRSLGYVGGGEANDSNAEPDD